MAEAEDKQEEGKPKPPLRIMGLNLPTFLFIVVNVIFMSGTLGYIYYMKFVYVSPILLEIQAAKELKDKAEKEQQEKLAVDGEVRMLKLPELNINLRTNIGDKQRRFATIVPALECNNIACMEELKALQVKVKDIIQTTIASRSYQELRKSEATFRLKHEITQKINDLLNRGTVTDTYFTKYVLQ